MTVNLTQRHCADAIWNTRCPIPTQEFGQFFEKRRALHWRRRTRMDSSIHPCSRIWRMDTSGRREVDNLRQRRNRATSSRATRVISHRRVRLFATLASLSHPGCRLAALRDDDGISPRPQTRPLGHPSLLKNPEVGYIGCVGWGEGNVGWKSTSLCDILLPLLSTAFDSPRTHPCSRIWTVDHSFLARQHRQAEEYASLRLSPRSCAPGSSTCCSSRRARQHHALTRPACDAIPAQEIGQFLGRVDRTS